MGWLLMHGTHRETCRMKFSYRYTTPEFRHKTVAQGNVFTSPFSSEFNI